MRIVLVVPRLVGVGPVHGAVALAKQLRLLGAGVSLVALAPVDVASALYLEVVKARVEVASPGLPSWQSLPALRRYRRLLASIGPDVVCSYGIRPDFLNALPRRRWAAFSSVRGMYREEYRLRYGRWASVVGGGAHVRLLRRMDGVVALSIAMRKWLLDEGLSPAKVHHVPNFLDAAWLDRPLEPGGSGHDHGRWDIAIVGPLGIRKRVDWAIEAVASLRAADPPIEVRLHVIGDGALRPALQARSRKLGVEERIVFHGWLNDVAPTVRDMDLVLHTSASEGVPRAVMEAMALGKTVLAGRIAGVEDLIEDGVSGYLFEPESKRALDDRLQWVLRERAFLPPEQVRERLVEGFSPRACAEQTMAMFEAAVTARSLVGRRSEVS